MLITPIGIVLLLVIVLSILSVHTSLSPFWIKTPPDDVPDPKDTYTGFRGSFNVCTSNLVHIKLIGTGPYLVFLDGELIADGPARFPQDHPEYETLSIEVETGNHVIAVFAYHAGVLTRFMKALPPFIACQVVTDEKEIPVEWKCLRMEGYVPEVRRLLGCFGYSEWCDTRKNPEGWQLVSFDDSTWSPVVSRQPEIGAFKPLTTAGVLIRPLSLEPIANGFTAETYGYETDDPPLRFFVRDLEPTMYPPDGVWRRYDLGRTRLGRPRFVLDLPEGTVVEFGYTEMLRTGRVSPFIALGGTSCYMDHYVARGGVQEFLPIWPKGYRYMEVHIKSLSSQVEFVSEEFLERAYHGDPEGEFRCEDPLLNRIWIAGMDTYRACSEDAITDCPTRERGQWIGDIVNAEMDIAAVGYSDLRLVRRALHHSAWCARADGLVEGMTPDQNCFLPTYSLQWVSAIPWYWKHTGDRSVLEELLPYAEANFKAFEPYVTDEGLTDGLGWVFVDWGYVRNEGPSDMAFNLFFIEALQSMQMWMKSLGHEDRIEPYRDLEKRVVDAVARYLASSLEKGGWEEVGYHRAVLALRAGLVSREDEPACIQMIKRHMMNCFPNNPDAPRLADPGIELTQLITPYFASFAFPPLIERGEMDFILDQYRTCWGWALSMGITTSLEVFDTRWSQCHAWAGCPTWQLSRYGLGLWPRFDLGSGHFDLKLIPGSLDSASGSIPVPDGDPIQIEWVKSGSDHMEYRFTSTKGLIIHVGDQEIEVNGELVIDLRFDGSMWSL